MVWLRRIITAKVLLFCKDYFRRKITNDSLTFFWTELISAMYIPDSIDRGSTLKITVQEIIGQLKIGIEKGKTEYNNVYKKQAGQQKIREFQLASTFV